MTGDRHRRHHEPCPRLSFLGVPDPRSKTVLRAASDHWCRLTVNEAHFQSPKNGLLEFLLHKRDNAMLLLQGVHHTTFLRAAWESANPSLISSQCSGCSRDRLSNATAHTHCHRCKNNNRRREKRPGHLLAEQQRGPAKSTPVPHCENSDCCDTDGICRPKPRRRPLPGPDHGEDRRRCMLHRQRDEERVTNRQSPLTLMEIDPVLLR